MKIYRHWFVVNAPLDAVGAFHRNTLSMSAITPPPIVVQTHAAPEVVGEGDSMDFSLWVGFFPIRWVAHFENVSREGFIDRQVRGPFAHWEHRHEFLALDETTTEVRDTIHADFRPERFWRLVGMSMWLGMPLLFAFRARKTRRLIEKQP